MGKGLLVFKGDKPKKKKKKKSKRTKHEVGESSSSSRKDDKPSPQGSGGAGSTSSSAAAAAASAPTQASKPAAAAPAAASQSQSRIEDGEGSITTSGTVLMGHGTRLRTVLRSGDAIIVALPNGTEEMRVLTMVLSEVSGAVSTPFSSNLSVPTEFRYIRKPRDVAREKSDRAKKVKVTKEEEERSAFGLYGTGSELVYRETTEHGGYRIRREKVGADASRGDLLHMRTKKKSDKYC